MSLSSKVLKKSSVTSVAAAHMLHDIFSSFFAPLIPLLREKLGFSYGVAGMLAVVQKLPSLLNPLIGIIADKMVIRSGLVVAPMITIVVMSLLGWAPSVAVLTILLFVCGLSAAVFHVTAPVLMRHVSGNKVGWGMSFFMFGGEMARTLGPLLLTSAVSWWGLEGIWRLIPIGMVASFLLFLNLRKIDKTHLKKVHKAKKTALKATLREVAPFFILTTSILLFRGFSKTALTTFLPSYMVDNGYSFKTASLAFAFLELFGATGVLFAGGLSDRAGRKKILLGIMLLTPFLMYFFTITAGILQWIVLGSMGLVFFASTPVFMAMIQDLNSERPSLMNGIFMTVSFAASSIVSLSVGFMADHFGFIVTYQITAVLSAFAFPLTLFLKDKSTKE